MTGRELIVYVPPRRKRGRPTDYDPAFCERVIEYGREGMCRQEICAELDISFQTFSNWLKVHREFFDAATRAKELENAWWLKAGREGIFNRHFNAQGWALQFRNRFPEQMRLRDPEPGDHTPQDVGALRHAMERKLSRIAAGSAASVPFMPDAPA